MTLVVSVIVIVLLLVASLMLALAKAAALGDQTAARALDRSPTEPDLGVPCPVIPFKLAQRRREHGHPWRSA